MATNKNYVCLGLLLLVLAASFPKEAEAGHKIKLKKLLKYGLLAGALHKKTFLPLPIPIPIHVETQKPVPIPIHHHSFDLHHGDFGGGHDWW